MTADGPPAAGARDRRYMDAALRYARRHLGRTGTNPSVGTLLVAGEGDEERIVGRGITALGGRPHAEAAALAEAGVAAKGATAYVTLEPCAHHGRTPPCAEALGRAGIARLHSAAPDPDARVDGKGHAMLRAAGVEVRPGLATEEAERDLGGYLSRLTRGRPRVTLKLALSADGMLGRAGGERVRITGPEADRQTHLERALADAILVGAGTVEADDPSLDCRLPGLAERSPLRLVLDPSLRSAPTRKVFAGDGPPTEIAVFQDADSGRRSAFADARIGFLAAVRDPVHGGVALPELLEDLGARGFSDLFVEGGRSIAESVLRDDLADRLILAIGPAAVGEGGIPAPIDRRGADARFRLLRTCHYGSTLWLEYERRI